MIDILGTLHPDSSHGALAQDLSEFLFALEQRGLIHEAMA
jgi:hypothetical protein